VVLKIRHYVLVLLTLLTIAFAQPLVLFLGGLTLIGSVTAFIFSDLPPEKQDVWERKLNEFIQRLLGNLRKKQPKSGKNGRFRNRKGPVESSSLIEEAHPDSVVRQIEEKTKTDWTITEVVKPADQTRSYDTEQH
jgi:hypothetical protein